MEPIFNAGEVEEEDDDGGGGVVLTSVGACIQAAGCVYVITGRWLLLLMTMMIHQTLHSLNQIKTGRT